MPVPMPMPMPYRCRCGAGAGALARGGRLSDRRQFPRPRSRAYPAMTTDDIREQAEELHGIADEKGAEPSDSENTDDRARDVEQSIHEAYEE